MRWATPIQHMRRTLTADVEMHGTKMSIGDKVTMWYVSANRDESAFVAPWRFDVARERNPHLSCGAGGTHFALGQI